MLTQTKMWNSPSPASADAAPPVGKAVFMAGTDTGVGKTWLSVRLLTHLRAQGLTVAGMKPVECGGREDAAALLAASSPGLSLDEINPLHTPEPLAPAALTPPPEIDFAALQARCASLQRAHDFVLVEGAGGWLVPLDAQRTMADLALALGLPVILVAANRLGVLNQVLLSLQAVGSAGLSCRAVFLNSLPGEEDPSQASNARVLRERLPDLPVITDEVAELAARLWP